MVSEHVDMIAIDGPSGVGKGTLSTALAKHLGWHLLESGALYRLVSLRSLQEKIEIEDIDALVSLIQDWQVEFKDGSVIYGGANVSADLRDQAVEERSSRVARIQAVRAALLVYQKSCRRSPGLVAEGRDMGTVVFPQAPLKIFLTASEECRAHRRYLQLKANGEGVRMSDLLSKIQARDKRDRERSVSPLVAAEGAITVDSTDVDAQVIFDKVLKLWEQTKN